MYSFELYLPTRLIFGKDSVKRIPDILEGHQNILLTYGGGSIKKIGLYDEVKKLLAGKNIFELSGIAPNPKVQSARDGVRIARENHADAILAVGGGSVLDLSKLISAAISYDGDPWELVLDPSKVTSNPVPLYDVLTLSATGSEYDNSGVISNPDTDEKMPIFGNLNPVASIPPTPSRSTPGRPHPAPPTSCRTPSSSTWSRRAPRSPTGCARPCSGPASRTLRLQSSTRTTTTRAPSSCRLPRLAAAGSSQTAWPPRPGCATASSMRSRPSTTSPMARALP